MESLVRLTTSKHGSIGSHWFLKKMKLDTYISGKVPVSGGDEAKSLLAPQQIPLILYEIKGPPYEFCKYIYFNVFSVDLA